MLKILAKVFLPDVGPLLYLNTPTLSSSVRVETGVIQGDTVSVHYDPMIAKLVCHGANRSEALRTLQLALEEYRIVGLTTNLDFLSTVVKHEAFIAADVETGFIKKHEAELFPDFTRVTPELLVRAALRLILADQAYTHYQNLSSQDSQSPWDLTDNFRPNLTFKHIYKFVDAVNPNPIIVEMQNINSTYNAIITYPDEPTSVTISNIHFLPTECSNDQHLVAAELNHHCQVTPVIIHTKPDGTTVLTQFTPDGQVTLTLPSHLTTTTSESAGTIRSPMPCKITQVLVKPGDTVTKDQPLVVLEAMKMEHIIKAPQSGKIAKVVYSQVGQVVPDNAELVIFESSISLSS